MFQAGYQRISKVVRLHYKSDTVYTDKLKKKYKRQRILCLGSKKALEDFIKDYQHCAGDQIEKNGNGWCMYHI